MFDCANVLLDYHDDEVNVTEYQRARLTSMSQSLRRRIRRGLRDLGYPQPMFFHHQGSYAMRTMIQDIDSNYDIDDGIYFRAEDLVNKRGSGLSPLLARQMVHDAIYSEHFHHPPEYVKNCVRVYYSEGFHIDIPVYRVNTLHSPVGDVSYGYELASSTWRPSAARDVTKWFSQKNRLLSPSFRGGGQLRRIVRLIKDFARSRYTWEERIAGGFILTVLAVECFSPHPREDIALYQTICAIRDRLQQNLQVTHPILRDTYLTDGLADTRTLFLFRVLQSHLPWLNPLFRRECTEESALNVWDTFFHSYYFSNY